MGQLETYLVILMGLVRSHLRVVRDEAGYTVQVVILTAIFALLAITVGAIIVSKVLAKTNSIDLNGGGQ